MKRDIKLRRNGDSLVMTMPVDLVRAYQLSPGDIVAWDGGWNGATVKFFRVSETRTPALRQEAEVAAELTEPECGKLRVG
jgi:antitoxin component of MazEF toxin-antitoxin module